jgi:hypothetical protein
MFAHFVLLCMLLCKLGLCLSLVEMSCIFACHNIVHACDDFMCMNYEQLHQRLAKSQITFEAKLSMHNNTN